MNKFILLLMTASLLLAKTFVWEGKARKSIDLPMSDIGVINFITSTLPKTTPQSRFALLGGKVKVDSRNKFASANAYKLMWINGSNFYNIGLEIGAQQSPRYEAQMLGINYLISDDLAVSLEFIKGETKTHNPQTHAGFGVGLSYFLLGPLMISSNYNSLLDKFYLGFGVGI